MAVLPFNDLESVCLSIYSISPPTGIPDAILVIFTSCSSNSLTIYKAVVSPSKVGFVAIITSSIASFLTLSTSSPNLNSFGPIPFNGDKTPFNTWKRPLYSPVDSIIVKSWDCSTTQRILSRFNDEHILQGSTSV